ncbi:protein-disulfide reductase DsbD family protein [Enterovibrio nigricans]|uniref:Suppressor for copper-sensitivity B n=1 Tax=Enterovibrio nigricans DSM 22720 TaxID=1121868 RepID=A0A1T4VMN9_9GAMM|nr:protein-disulfide reductase DsbD domain-containing protein [Enterovibrio nigricans]PKF49604.1 cytochrome C biogenesis protein [Enterovibrio nigricans]SKA66230.1 suppressor for copper-sensitivity B [Enterovibrio nigricans DSM 22720]
MTSKADIFYVFRHIFAALLFVFAPLQAQAEASSTGWLKNPSHPPIQSRVVLTGSVNADQQTADGFLEVSLEGDWKTYWRSPGEGGIAPSLNWQQSENIENVDWLWPSPQRFDLLGIDTLGYKGDVIFPITLHIEDMTKPATFAGTLTISSCTTVCVLTDYPFSLSFTPGELSVDTSALHLYAKEMSNVPKPSPQLNNIQAVWDQAKQQLQVSAEKTSPWQSPDIIVDGKTDALLDVAFSIPKVSVNGNKVSAVYSTSSWMGTPSLAGEELSLTFQDNSFIAEQHVQAQAGIVSTKLPAFSLGSAIVFALIGGLILNIMPCVLPVLGLKLSSVISARGMEKSQIRRQFLASGSGIIFSFWLIAAFLIALKMTGNAIGWGVQFQSPIFIGLMTAITALFAANMLGLFEIRLSSNTNTWMATRGSNAYSGHFIQGMFATLLATPCSAPFLGTAVAFALAATTPTLIAIFTALGIGMALPWLVIAAVPSLAERLPKPGAWMNKVKVLFGTMMFVTSLWLASLLTNHLPFGLVVLLSITIIALALWRTTTIYGKKTAILISGIGIMLSAATLLIASLTSAHWVTPLPQDLPWQTLSDKRITQEVSAGNVVFVDVTADWCITCKANKIGVLLQDPVYSRLQAADMVTLQGDWTVPSDSVTSYLQKHGRYGVPFNIVYGPNAPEGIPLPVVLSDKDVMNAINWAKGEQHE